MDEGDELQHLLGYQLQMAQLQTGRGAREALAPFGVTPAKFAALLIIRDNAGCDQTALGQALAVNRSSAMKLVNALVDLRLIERQPGRDLRTNALHLTAHGAEQIDIFITALRASDLTASATLSAAERHQLLNLLRKLRDR